MINAPGSSPSGPARRAGGDRQPDGRGARDGRRPAGQAVRAGAVQPRHAGPAPAGFRLQAFVLAAALRKGIDPYSTWESRKKLFTSPTAPIRNEKFVVNNFEGSYSGITTLEGATTHSDNSVFAEVGIKVGTRNIAKIAREMGIRTPVSTNIAMTLGGLKQGVTPLDMAHAYETLATGGKRVTGTLGATEEGPVGIKEVEDPLAHRTIKNKTEKMKAVSQKLAETETSVLQTVVQSGQRTDQGDGRRTRVRRGLRVLLRVRER